MPRLSSSVTRIAGFPSSARRWISSLEGGSRALAEGRVFESEREVVLGADVDLAIEDIVHSRAWPAGGPRRRTMRASTPDSPMSPSAVWRDRAVRGIGPSSPPSRPCGGCTRAPPAMPRGCSAWDRPGTKSAWPVPRRSSSSPDRSPTRTGCAPGTGTARRWRSFPPRCCSRCTPCLATRETSCGWWRCATQALVVGAVLLAVFASLSQRRRQLGVLRALGASRRYVFLAVWLHVSFLVALGAGLGVLLGWGGARACLGRLAPGRE